MKVIVEKLTDNAKVPTKVYDKDFCYDVYATSCEEIEPGIWMYGIGLAFEIERGWEKLGLGEIRDRNHWVLPQASGELSINFKDTPIELSLDFRPRSSVWKTGLILSNCEGTLDELYRGEVLAYFYEVIPGKEKYKVGDRIGQIKLGFTLPIEFVEGKVNKDTSRGTGGFGSTGK